VPAGPDPVGPAWRRGHNGAARPGATDPTIAGNRAAFRERSRRSDQDAISVGVLVCVLQVFLVDVRVLVRDSVVAVFMLVLDV